MCPANISEKNPRRQFINEEEKAQAKREAAKKYALKTYTCEICKKVGLTVVIKRGNKSTHEKSKIHTICLYAPHRIREIELEKQAKEERKKERKEELEKQIVKRYYQKVMKELIEIK